MHAGREHHGRWNVILRVVEGGKVRFFSLCHRRTGTLRFYLHCDVVGDELDPEVAGGVVKPPLFDPAQDIENCIFASAGYAPSYSSLGKGNIRFIKYVLELAN